MSLVTNIILTTCVSDEDTFSILVEALKLRDPPILAPIRVDQHGTLAKAMEANVYIAAYNYLRLHEFVQAIEIVAWEYPEGVRLFVEKQDDENGFHEVLLKLEGERRKITRCDLRTHRAVRKLAPGEEAELMKPPYYCQLVGCRARPEFVCYCGKLLCGTHVEVPEEL